MPEDLHVDLRGSQGGSRRRVVLVVDDEADILVSLKELFEASVEGVVVHAVDSGPAGLEVLQRGPVDLLVTDYKMPGMNGLEFLDRAKRLAPGVPRILITAFPDLQVAIRAINEAGIENFITKPFEPTQVLEVVRAVLVGRRAGEPQDQGLALDALRRQLGAGGVP